ncbi:MAG: site-specific DNA-methyltransferase [Elusimicrobia bacterium CG11_big_fil_rev_8_21_14_0_20_64_6]|nr:MAG: site-specific DNA-methyltransferase [Elusimicrobia bacterium CG11_big_fil_rev_8_21_14_0_20_64_6]
MLDEIFGTSNCLAIVAWEKRFTRSNNARMFYSIKDSLLIYRKSPAVDFLREARTEKSDSIYKNPDKDPKGPWTSASYVNPATKAQRPNLVYPIRNPTTGKMVEHPTHAWKFERSEHEKHVQDNRLWWGRSGTARFPRLKVFPKVENGGLVPVDIWKYQDTGTTDEGGNELKSIFGSAVFDNPKPTKLIHRILQFASGPNDLIMDSFAGSGTTGHAVHTMNQKDGGQRRFILIEMDPMIARDITAERVRRVLNGSAPGHKSSDSSAWGFRFCELDAPLFEDSGKIRPSVTFADLARHVYFTETGEPLPKERVGKSPFLGECRDVGIYLLYNGILGDKSAAGGNILTRQVLGSLPPFKGQKIIYCAGNLLGKERLESENVVVRQTPYEIKIA